MPALLDAFLAGGQAGTRDREIRHENQRRSKLGDLMSQAYGAPSDQRSGLLSQMAAVDPNSAMSAQKHFGDMDDQRRQRLGQFAAVFDALPDEQKAVAYPQFAAQAKEVLGVPVPDQWDPAFAPRIRGIAQALGSGGTALAPRVVGNALVDATGKVLYQGEAQPVNGQIINVPDGQGGMQQMIFDPRTRQISEPQYPGQGQPAATAGAAPQIMGDALSSSMDPQAIQNEFKTLAPQFGAQISSLTRTPERNAAVGGVPNSQHLAGTAGDFVVPEANKGAFRQAMQQRGFEVIDEGDHMHVELPPNRKVAQGGPRLGYTPPKPAGGEESYGQPQPMTGPDGKVRMVQFGNRGGMREVQGYGAPPTARDAKPPTDAQLQAAGFYDRMSAAERELEATVNAGYKPGNVRDHYTAGQGPFMNWAASDEGQKYRQQQEDWVRSKLRKESGAVIGDDEMEREIKVYFPQPGDSKTVIDQKAKSRKIAIEAMKRNAGRALPQESAAPPSATGGVDDLLSKYGIL